MSKAAVSDVRRDAPSAFAATRLSEAYEYFRLIGRDCAQLLPAPGPNPLDPAGRRGCGLDRHQSARARPPAWHPAGLRPDHSECGNRDARLLSIGIGCALVMETILRIVRSRVIAWSAMKLAWKAERRRGLPHCDGPRRAGRCPTRRAMDSAAAGGRDDLRFPHQPGAAGPHRPGLRRHLLRSAVREQRLARRGSTRRLLSLRTRAHRARARAAQHCSRAPGWPRPKFAIS